MSIKKEALTGKPSSKNTPGLKPLSKKNEKSFCFVNKTLSWIDLME